MLEALTEVLKENKDKIFSQSATGIQDDFNKVIMSLDNIVLNQKEEKQKQDKIDEIACKLILKLFRFLNMDIPETFLLKKLLRVISEEYPHLLDEDSFFNNEKSIKEGTYKLGKQKDGTFLFINNGVLYKKANGKIDKVCSLKSN